MAKTMYETTKDLGIKICPKCKKEYTGYPAISRVDNKTEICSHCGLMEGLDAYLNEKFKGCKETDSKYCIFEKKLCRFANKDDNTFKCTAPSDEAMTCYKI